VPDDISLSGSQRVAASPGQGSPGGVSFISALILFSRTLHSWSDGLLKAPPPSTNTLVISLSTCEFWGHKNIQIIAICSLFLICISLVLMRLSVFSCTRLSFGFLYWSSCSNPWLNFFLNWNFGWIQTSGHTWSSHLSHPSSWDDRHTGSLLILKIEDFFFLLNYEFFI
jgi:hypothetical protein